MKTPKHTYFMHDQVYQPAAEVQGQHTNHYRHADTGIEPINQAEVLVHTPVRQLDDKNSQKRMYHQMKEGKPKVYNGMFKLCFFVTQRQQWNCTFNDPKNEKTANQDRHALQRSFLQR